MTGKRIKTDREDYIDHLKQACADLEGDNFYFDPWVPEKRGAPESVKHIVGKVELNKSRIYVTWRKDLKTTEQVAVYKIREKVLEPTRKLNSLDQSDRDVVADQLLEIEERLKRRFPQGVPHPTDLVELIDFQESHAPYTRPVVVHNGKDFDTIGEAQVEMDADGMVSVHFRLDDPKYADQRLKHLIWRTFDDS